MLVKRLNFKLIPIEQNEEGIGVQQGTENILNEYKAKGYCNTIYNGYTDSEIVDKKLYVTEYQGQEFRGYIEECCYQEKKTYKVFIKDYNGDCFHIGYVPFNRVSEIEEWINNNKLQIKGNVFILGGNAKFCTQTDNELKTENKPYGFEVELRFYNNEKEKTKKRKADNRFVSKKNIILVGTILLILIVAVLFIVFSKAKFEIASFNIEAETTNFEYTTNITTYEGKGLIITPNKKDTYLVVIKVNLKSGGDENSKKEYCTNVLVTDGKGEFTTYISGDEDKTTKPEYEFEILGYIKFK